MSIVVVEFISQGFLDHGDVVDHAARVLGLLLTFGLVDHVLLYIVDFVLDGRFVAIFQN